MTDTPRAASDTEREELALRVDNARASLWRGRCNQQPEDDSALHQWARFVSDLLHDRNMLLARKPRPVAQDTPGMTDLMVTPESLDKYLADNPLPAVMEDGTERAREAAEGIAHAMGRSNAALPQQYWADIGTVARAYIDQCTRITSLLTENAALNEEILRIADGNGWRCFWCGLTFSHRDTAEKHFGIPATKCDGKDGPQCLEDLRKRIASMLKENAAQSDMLAVQTERAGVLEVERNRAVLGSIAATERAEKAEVRVSVLQNGLSIIADWDKAPITGEHESALIDIIRSICDRARRDLAGVRP